MIERVSLDAVDLDFADVFASVTIRHGRASVDGAPLGSTATLSLLHVTRAVSLPFRVGVAVEIDTVGAIPRFRGRVTDAALDPDAATLAILAVSTLARISGRKVGAGAYPAEPWSDRVERAFTDAGAIADLVLELGDDDPPLAARDADETDLAALLQELAETVPAAIADLPDGTVLVQALSSRKGAAPLELDPALVALSPEWAQADDVQNVVRVVWDGGTVEQTDAASIALYEEREPLNIGTTLANLTDANARALLELRRRSLPEWAVERAELLTLDSTLRIGDAIAIPEQPAAAPRDVALGMLEGWTDTIEPDGEGGLDWTMALALSPTRLSGYGASWAILDVGLSWDDLPVGLSWNESEDLLFA